MAQTCLYISDNKTLNPVFKPADRQYLNKGHFAYCHCIKCMKALPITKMAFVQQIGMSTFLQIVFQRE